MSEVHMSADPDVAILQSPDGGQVCTALILTVLASVIQCLLALLLQTMSCFLAVDLDYTCLEVVLDIVHYLCLQNTSLK